MKKLVLKIIKYTLIVVLIVYLITTIFKFVFLTIVQNHIDDFNNSENYYIKQENENSLQESYYKEGIYKIVHNGGTFFWNNGETSYVVDIDKHTITNMDYSGVLKPSISMSETILDIEEVKVRMLLAFMPNTYIIKTKYDGKDCFEINYATTNEKMYIDSKTLLPYVSDSINGKEIYTLDKGNVKDDDIDISKYM